MVKNQHYIPQFYLNQFSANDKRITVWKLDDDKILSRQLSRNYAAKRYFYDCDYDTLSKAMSEMSDLYPETENLLKKDHDQFIEKALGRCEADMAKVFREIELNDAALFDEKNRVIIEIFLHSLAYRTEAFRESIDNIYKQTIQFLEKLKIPPELVENVGYDGKTTQINELLKISSLLDVAEQLEFNYDWYIGEVIGEMQLVISDDPAKGIWLGFNDICIPVNGKKAIILRVKDKSAPIISDDKPVGNKIILSEKSVVAYNCMQKAYSKRFLFGDKTSLECIKLLGKVQQLRNK